jgi:HAMP domain-containing protein
MVTRRLIGPTILILLLFGLSADYLLFYESPWSATRFLGKALAIFGGIFAPFFDPKLYTWAHDLVVPFAVVLAIVVLLSVIVARAKTAMKKATPEPYESVVFRAEEPTAGVFPAEELSAPIPRKLGLVRKLALSYGVFSLLFGITVTLVVYGRMQDVLEREIKRRAEISALGLGELAGRSLGGSAQAALDDAIDELTSSRTVAYAYVEDPSGQIVAHSPRELLMQLRRDFPKSAERALKGVELDYRGLPVYEIAVRLGDVKSGYAHLAIWRDVIQEETRRVVAPMAGLILLLVSAATALFAWVVGIFNRPFVQLVDVASRISKGELDLEIGAARANELGDLARSVDRMRSKLDALLAQLEEPPSPERSKENFG